MNNNTTKPVEEVRIGAIKAAVWRNVVDMGNNSRPMYSVTFQRLYRDGDNTWKSTESFGRDDLLLLAKVAERTFERVHELQQSERMPGGTGLDPSQGQ
jgi:hypothetical protein